MSASRASPYSSSWLSVCFMEGMDRAGEPGKSWGGEADNVCDVFFMR